MIKKNIKNVSEVRKIIRKMFGEVDEDKSKNLFDIGKGVVDTRVAYHYSKKVKKNKKFPFGIKHVASYIPFKSTVVTGKDLGKG